MSLVLEVEFLTGVCRAARQPSDTAPDWPPQPDRVFSALVSAWAARGESAEERKALEWLETQPPPDIHASGHTARTAPDVFVPPNDPKYIKVMPDRRPRRSRFFPVAVPDDPNMALVWENEPEPSVFKALDMSARDISYLGHSTSFVRCRFLRGDKKTHTHTLTPARRRVYPGRLSELEQAHLKNPVRPLIRPGATNIPTERQDPPKKPNDWLILEVIDGTVPDVRATAPVCRLLRRTLMCGYRRIGQENSIPEIVSGHTPDGQPTRNPHIAIVPMTFSGFQHADGQIFGFALIPPNGKPLHEIPGLLKSFRELTDEKEERRVLQLKGPILREPLCLAPISVDKNTKKSLSPHFYLKESRIWASVTPVVLDRHLKRNDDEEIRELVARACEHAGHPRPDLNCIHINKHSAIKGMPPARPLANTPPWTRWKLPKPLASRPLTHVVIDFGKKVSGPILLGAGRFAGLGLFRGIKSQT